MTLTNQQIAEMALAEAERMSKAVPSTDAQAQVCMSTAQFVALANLIALLGKRLREPDPASFEDTRYWVPLDSFAQTRRAMQQLEAECHRLRLKADLAFKF